MSTPSPPLTPCLIDFVDFLKSPSPSPLSFFQQLPPPSIKRAPSVTSITVSNSFVPPPGSRPAPRLSLSSSLPITAQRKGWTNTNDKDKNSGKNQKKKTYSEESRKVHNKKKNKKRREKQKMAVQALKERPLMDEVRRVQDKMYEKIKQQGRINKELRNKLNIIEAQTKRNPPQKRQPKPQNERQVAKKNEIDLKKYRKVILVPK